MTLRIVHLITRLVHGGAQINTILTAAHQAQAGHSVWLACGPQTGAEGSLWPQTADQPFETVCLPHLMREVHPWHDLLAFAEIVRLLRRLRPDVVHTHTSKAGLLGRWAAWVLRVPIVIHTPHGHVFHGYFTPRTSRLFAALERWTAPITHRLVMLTETERREHLEAHIAAADKMVVVPSGVDLYPARRTLDRASCGLPARVPLIGCVARLAPIKGTTDLIDAMPAVVEAHGDAHLVLVGDGPLRGDIEARVDALGLRDHVTLLGHRPNPAEILAHLDVLVVPSRNEGMGRVAVEGMAAGLPIVATRVGGLGDVVADGETGLLVPLADTAALSHAISRLLDDPHAARRMGDAGKMRARRFGTQVMLEGLDAVYDALCCTRSQWLRHSKRV